MENNVHTQPIQIAIFGLGRAGQIHLKNLVSNPRSVVKYMVDLNMDTLKRMQQQFRMDQTELLSNEEAEKVFLDEELKAVVVSSTTTTHEDIIRRALKNGKAVFCEKPIANELEGIFACYRLARKTNGILHCSFNRRFDPSFLDARTRLHDEVGVINSIKTTSRDSPLPPMEYLRVSSGIFHDCAVHDLDLICWLLGEWPTSVFVMAHAQNQQIKEMGDVDVVNILLRFPSGVIGHIDLCRHSAVGYDQRLEVSGMKGMLKVENAPSNHVATFNLNGCHRDVIDYSFPQRYRESYQKSLDHFFNVVEGTEALAVDALSSINVSKLASVCEESYRQNKPMSYEPITTL